MTMLSGGDLGGAAGLFARLPPLWAVVALFVGLTLPQALLGLPVAAAEIGPVPALAVLAVVGLAMTIAAAAEAEALVRDGDFRRHGGYFGKLVQRYLGARAAAAPSLLAGLRTTLSVLGAYVGLSVSLHALTGLPRVLWGALAFTALAVMLLRGGLRIPAAVGALLGLACLPLLIAVGAIAVAHGGGDLTIADDASVTGLGSVIGLLVMLYISNVYVVQIAHETLPNAPGGGALTRGSAIGTVVLTVIAGAWLVSTCAALQPEDLRGETGTALGPLTREIGTVIAVPGTLLSLLLLGLGLERTSVAVTRLVSERLPARRQRLAVLAPLAVCLCGEALLALDAVSFSAVLSIAGIASNVLLAIALPLLLLLAARATGDVKPGPGATVPFFGRPAAVWCMVASGALLLVLFATVLSDRPALRIAAVLALAALAATVALATRAGAFKLIGAGRRGC